MGHPVLNREINSQGNLEDIQEVVQFDSEKGKSLQTHYGEEYFSEEKNEKN